MKLKFIHFLILYLLILIVEVFPIDIEYLGHSCLKITILSQKILVDPYSFEMNYPYLKKQNIKDFNLIISTHDHFDHFNKDIFDLSRNLNIPYLVGTKNDGKDWNNINYKTGSFEIFSIGTYHDNSKGKERGKNSIVVFKINKTKIVHLGDLGHMLDNEQIKIIKNCDLVFIPVGGYFTISHLEAVKIINSISPKIVVPIHYKTTYTLDFPISYLEEFLNEASKNLKDYNIIKFKGRKFSIEEINHKAIITFQ